MMKSLRRILSDRSGRGGEGAIAPLFILIILVLIAAAFGIAAMVGGRVRKANSRSADILLIVCLGGVLAWVSYVLVTQYTTVGR